TPIPTTAVVSTQPATCWPIVLSGLGLAGLAAIALFPVLLPLLSIGLVAISGVSAFILSMSGPHLGAGPAARPTAPEALAAPAAREPCRTVLFALAELERTLAAVPDPQRSMAPVLERCRAAAVACGQLALLADPLQRVTCDRIAGQRDRISA